MLISLIPFFILGYFLFFLKNNRLNNLLTGLIFVSFFVFATNYTSFGFEFNIFRYLHRIIGSLIAITIVFHVFKYRINVFKELMPRMLALFFLALLLSFIGNDIYVEYYVRYVRNFIFISFIVLYLYYMLDSNEKLEELMSLIVAITLILSCFIVLEIVQNGWGHKAELFYPNRNYLAYSLLPGFIWSFHSKSKYKWLSLCLIAFAIFLTTSRAVELSVVFSIFLYVFFRQYKLVYVTSGSIVAIAILVLFFDQIVLNQNFSNIRYVLAKISVNAFQENPINGMGYGQFKKNYSNYIDQDIIKMKNEEINEKIHINRPDFPNIDKYLQELPKENRDYIMNFGEKEQMTHNDLLTVVAELGLLGIACTVFLFYKLYIELQKLILHNREYFYLSISLIGGSLIFSLLHNNLTTFVFWFVIFIPFIMNRNYEKTT